MTRLRPKTGKESARAFSLSVLGPVRDVAVHGYAVAAESGVLAV